MDIAKKLGSRSGFSTNSAGLGVADEYVEIERDGERAKSQWEKLRRENPYGFDVVVRTHECSIIQTVVTMLTDSWPQPLSFTYCI